MLSDCDGVGFRKRAGARARALGGDRSGWSGFLAEFGESEDSLVAELVSLVRNRLKGNADPVQADKDIERTITELEKSA